VLKTQPDAHFALPPGSRNFSESGKPVAAICHGPWMLMEADVVNGRNLTSRASLKTDNRNAGGEWVDEEVVVDQGVITSYTSLPWARGAAKKNELPESLRRI
jgi:putative intracellular protease/amidase